MDKTNPETVITAEYFNSICRICMDNVQEANAYNINCNLKEIHEMITESEEALTIRDVFCSCTSIKVSTELQKVIVSIKSILDCIFFRMYKM